MRCLCRRAGCKFPALLLLLRKRDFPASVTSQLKQIQSKWHGCLCSLSGDHDWFSYCMSTPKKRREMWRPLYPHFSSQALPEEGKPESALSSRSFPILCLVPDQNHTLPKGKRRTREEFVIYLGDTVKILPVTQVHTIAWNWARGSSRKKKQGWEQLTPSVMPRSAFASSWVTSSPDVQEISPEPILEV